MKPTEVTTSDKKMEKLIEGFFKKQTAGFSSVRVAVNRDNTAHEKREREAKQRETGEERFGSDANFDIPQNKNRASASEEREDYIWKIPLIIIVIVVVGIFIVTYFG